MVESIRPMSVRLISWQLTMRATSSYSSSSLIVARTVHSGQLARYMGWIKIQLAKDRDVRGVVVARAIDEKLRYAACVMPNVELLEYEVEFRLRPADSIARQP